MGERARLRKKVERAMAKALLDGEDASKVAVRICMEAAIDAIREEFANEYADIGPNGPRIPGVAGFYLNTATEKLERLMK